MADYTLSAKITGDASGFQGAINTAQTAINNLGGKFDSLSLKLSSLSSAFAPLSMAASAAGAVGVKSFASFEEEMSKVGAISGATGSDMEALTEKAKQMGATTKFSATESGQAMEYMAMAGWKTEDMLQGIDGIMSLAAASGEDLATTSDIVTDALTAFGLSANDSGHFADILAAASSNANTNVSMMGETFKYCAPIAGAMGFSAEETAEAIGLMANSGIKASQAGTSLRTIMTNLSGEIKFAGKNLGEVTIATSNADGSMRDLNDILGDCRVAFSKMTESEKTAAAETLVGKNAMSGFLALMNSGEGDIEKLRGAIAGCTDETIGYSAAADMAEKMMNNLSGKVTIMKSTLEGAAIVIGETLAPYVITLVEGITDLANKFINLDEGTQKTIIAIGAVVAAIAPALLIMSKLSSGLGTVFKGLSILASPVGIVVAAVAALAAGFVYLMNTNQAFHDRVMTVWDSVKAKIQTVVNGLSGISFDNIFSGLQSAFDKVAPTVGGVIEGVIGAVQNLLPVFNNIFGTIKTVIGYVVEAFKGFFSGLSSGFSSGLSGASGFSSGLVSIIGLISPPLKAVILLFQNFAPQIQALVTAIGSNLVPVFTTLGTTIGGIVSAVLPAIQSAMANLIPVIASIISAVTQIVTTVLPVVIGLINQLAPFLVQIAQVIGQIVAALAPMIAQLIETLLPVITNIVTVIMNVITAIMPALIAIINVVMAVIQALVPIITNILSVVVSVISGIISAINPIISFIGGVISAIMAVISPIVTFVSNIIATVIKVIGTIIGTITGIFATVFSIVSGVFSNISEFISTTISAVSTVISTLTGIVGGVFNAIYSTVSSVMQNVGNFIQGIFTGIQSAWNGLTSFVSGVFDGVASAVSELVSHVRGFVNGVISGINSAIGVINMIPGVSIGEIPYLLHGTDDWSGGFARMNEGGRGELTYLPNGTQVIPHDISMKYAKEAARANVAGNDAMVIDYGRLASTMLSALSGVKIEHVSTLNGKTVASELTPLINKRLGKQYNREERG